MKKHLLFLMLFAGSIIAFTSCKKDDDATLDGTWASTKMVQMSYINDVLKGESTIYLEEDERLIIAFQGNQWIQYGAGSDEIPSFSADQTFIYADGKISFTGASELPPQIDVKSLTGRTLVLKMEQTEDNSDGENVRQVQEITFEKR